MNVRDDNVSEETKKLISSLPTYKDSLVKLCKYQGCWYYYNTLQAVINFQNNFQPQDTDIILASFPKSGTTWLKALSVALLERSKHDDPLNHPLLSGNPHGIVPFFEMDMYLKSPTPDLTKFTSSSSSSSSRLFSTHMPLHTVKQGLKDSPCKVVYLCRNAKDALISRWYFRSKCEKKDVSRSILEVDVRVGLQRGWLLRSDLGSRPQLLERQLEESRECTLHEVRGTEKGALSSAEEAC